jgi:hypothetical protein
MTGLRVAGDFSVLGIPLRGFLALPGEPSRPWVRVPKNNSSEGPCEASQGPSTDRHSPQKRRSAQKRAKRYFATAEFRAVTVSGSALGAVSGMPHKPSLQVSAIGIRSGRASRRIPPFGRHLSTATLRVYVKSVPTARDVNSLRIWLSRQLREKLRVKCDQELAPREVWARLFAQTRMEIKGSGAMAGQAKTSRGRTVGKLGDAARPA